jgi:hypothetical protein
MVAYVHAQDTLTYKGLIMTPRTSVSISSDTICNCSDSTINPGLDHVWFPVDKTFDYLSQLDKGVFFSKYTKNFRELVPDNLRERIEYPLIHKNLLKDSTQNYLLFEPPISSFVNNECGKIYFYILDVEIKFIHLDTTPIEFVNLNAEKFKDIFFKLNTIKNYITEIVYIKPYMPIHTKPASDTLSYEGLIMTRDNPLYPDKSNNISDTIYGADSEGFFDFFVPIKKKYNYEKSFLKGIYITSEFEEESSRRIPECDYLRRVIRYLFQANRLNTKLPPQNRYSKLSERLIDLYKFRIIQPTVKVKGSEFWQKWWVDRARRYFINSPNYKELITYKFRYFIYKTKFKYINVGTLEFETENPHARNRREAFLKHQVPVYFITEIEYIKPPQELDRNIKGKLIIKKI